LGTKEGLKKMEFEQEFQKKIENIDRKSVVCTVSGGLDSAVAAGLMFYAGFQLHFIFFDWGQKTLQKEFQCALALSKFYNADLKVVEVPLLKSLPGISLTQHETMTLPINEYVPNRNAILESQSVAYAEFVRAGAVCIGSTGGDHICPDNSPKFVKIMQNLVDQGTMLKPSIKMIAPLINTDKIGAVKIGLKLGVPFENTWSCHNNVDRACAKCSNCKSRLEAFSINNYVDPIEYYEK